MEVVFVLVAVVAVVYALGRFGTREPSNSSPATKWPSVSDRITLPDTFDEDVFTDPKTGHFCFPTYRTPKTSPVKIVDATNYGQEMWYGLEACEKQVYSLADFEHDFCSTDIEVDSFWAFLDRAKARDLRGYGDLAGNGDDLRSLLEHWEWDDPASVFAETPFDRKLIDKGFLDAQVVNPGDEEEAEYVSGLSVPELKDICRSAGLRMSGRKQELINRIVEAKAATCPPVVTRSETFEQMMQDLYALYSGHIREAIDNWHPFVIADVWEVAIDEADVEGLRTHIECIRASAYWRARIRPESALG
jgi:hypothetical protein